MPRVLRAAWGAEDEFAWRRFAWFRGRLATATNSLGQRLRIRLDSLGDIYAAFGREEERNMVAVLRQLPRDGVVLDVGAHIGGYAVISAEFVGPNGKVFAFEPMPQNADLLEDNARLNGLSWITTVRAAVGRQRASIELLISDVDSMWASTRSTWADTLHHGKTSEHVRVEKVPLLTIDDFLAEKDIKSVALMKVDVEAAEMDVLAGAAGALASGRIREVLVEVHGPTVSWQDVRAILQQYGFEVREVGGSEMLGSLKTPRAGVIVGRRPVSVALIGCGAVSEILYGPALKSLAGEAVMETVALVDLNSPRAQAISNLLPTARVFASVDAMFSQLAPDLAIVAAPHRFHVDLTLRCLEKSAAVLCEKPMAVTTVECDRMITAAERGNRVLAVGHFRRFFPSCQAIKAILNAGLLGPVRSFRFLEGETYSWPAQSASFFNRNDAGGGVLIDAGAHTIDLLLWWLGDVAEFEYADDSMGGVEANCLLRLKMTSGATGSVQLSRDWPLPNRYVIDCQRGWVAYVCDVVDRVEWGLHDSGFGLDAQIRKMNDSVQPDLHSLGTVGPGFMDCFVSQLRNVAAAVTGREPLFVSGAEARKTVALIEACYHQRTLLEMPWLDPLETHTARKLAHV